MSAIPYGTPIVNGTFVTAAGTRQEIVTGLEAQLAAAGWSTISGGGSADVLMRSQVTPAPKSNSIRARLRDTGAGISARLTIKSDSGLLESQQHFLVPAAGKTFRVIACPYSAWVMVDGSVAAGDHLAFGTLNIPTFLEGVITGDLGWIWGSSFADGVNLCENFRNFFRGAYRSAIVNGTLMNANDTGTGAMGYTYPADSVSALVNKWHDDSIMTNEFALAFGVGVGELRKTRGLVYNAMVIREAFPLDDTSIINYDGHGWRVFTSNGATPISIALAVS